MTFLLLIITGYANADTIYKKDGSELKGIVVEDYKDRVTFSTADGEISIMKSDIKELYYDTEEDNLIKLAEQAQAAKDFVSAYAYYDMAFKLNPESKRAKDGIVFIRGYLFRKEEVQKEEMVKMMDEFEHRCEAIQEEKAEDEKLKENVDKLKKSLGLELRLKGNHPQVESAAANSPAYEAGLREGDLIVAIWGRLTGYMPLKEVIEILLEKPALEIKCTIERIIEVKISYDRTLLSGPDELIGASFSMEFDGLTVSEVREGGASFRAGLKKEDIIVALDGNSTRYMPLKKAVEYIRDSKAELVILTIRREFLIWRRESV